VSSPYYKCEETGICMGFSEVDDDDKKVVSIAGIFLGDDDDTTRKFV